VPETEQGELQGALTSLNSLISVVAPVVMTQLFGIFTAAHAPVYFPGAPFLAAALFEGLGLVWFVVASRRLRHTGA
jgi:MFS transporter, DHA1 family, tetracycline resistance protein